MLIRSSLRKKITLGYYGIASLIVGLSLFSLIDLHVIEQKIRAGERISEFFDISLEIRRFEKNFFLYHQLADYEENAAYVGQAKRVLQEDAEGFRTLAGSARFTKLVAALTDYSQLMERYARTHLSDPIQALMLEQRIRTTGKELVTIAEQIARQERTMLQHWLDGHGTRLMIFVAGLTFLVILLGHLLSRRVVRPLKHMEENMEAVANGKLRKLDIQSSDGEIISLTNAFNHVLQELELRQKHLVRTEKLASLGTLLSGVAHELNNPLSNISTSCQILLEELHEPDMDFKRELLTQIDDQTQRARAIVHSLLNFARDRESAKRPIALGPLIAETLQFIKGQVPTRVRIATDIPSDIVLVADEQRLQQAFLNLVVNAVEATEGAGVVTITAVRNGAAITPGMHLVTPGECEHAAETVDIRIHDNGHGIPASVLPRIFDPFFTTKEIGKGSGLGLSIVHEIIEEHGGCIAVESEPGQGTTFFIRLPVGQTDSFAQYTEAIAGNAQ